MKKLVIPAVILLLTGLAFSQTADWYNGSFTEAQSAARQGEKAILVDFFSDG